jgi:hypothetical protein
MKMRLSAIIFFAASLASGVSAAPSPSPFGPVRAASIPNQITPVASIDRTEAERLSVEAIDSAKSVIVFAQPTLRSRVIAEALLRAKDRGIFIGGIMDPTQSNEAAVSRFLIERGIPISHWKGDGAPLPSFVVIDYQVVLIGQYTWDQTGVALPLVRISEYGTGAKYHNFWNDLHAFTEIDPQVINNRILKE